MFVRDLALDECRKVLSQSTFGRLSCARENQPYTVPVHFAVDDGDVYLFSMPGRKIDWMRENPRVCLELDSIDRDNQWTSVIALGRYEELPDTPDFQDERLRALNVLQKRAMWWEPASVAPAGRPFRSGASPVVYRILIESLTGRQGAPLANEDSAPREPDGFVSERSELGGDPRH
jgi:nitroimidazol reductase NimA-like FMN-containing flavoprotein (pyridoxamine 5'-phosphate oxidase superfamily)